MNILGIRLRLLLIAAIITQTLPTSVAGEFSYDPLGISIKTDDDWSIMDQATLSVVNRSTAMAPIFHAKKLGLNLDAAAVDSSILMLHSRVPIGAAEDNPNIILAKEKAWSNKYEHTGSGYLSLMKDRLDLLGAPTDFIGKPIELKINNQIFHVLDAVNKKIKGIDTKQKYICTYIDGYYVYFVLSYNRDDDPDFIKMIEIVRTFNKV